MSVLGSLREEAKSARRGVVTLFGVTGFLLAYWWDVYGPDHLRLVLGILCLAVSVGLWRNWRWARWLAMGACFLTVVVAFGMPVILMLWRPFDAYSSDTTQVSLFTCAAAGAVGVIGYKGLGYFRSVAAWQAFSNNEKDHDALANENSLHVVVSALCIALVMGMVAVARGVTAPRLPTRPTALPDLQIDSLCMSGENLVQARVLNLGTGSSPERYTLEYNDLRGRGGMSSSWGVVPAPGQSGYVVLDNATNQTEEDGVRQVVRLYIDSNHEIKESNESNNSATFDIIYNYFHPGNLPRCP